MPYHLLFETEQKFDHYFLEGEENSIAHLPNFNDINIIIGSNNSGKSQFVRSLIKSKKFLVLNSDLHSKYNGLLTEKMPIINQNPWGSPVYPLPLNFNIKVFLEHNFEQLKIGGFGELYDISQSLRDIAIGLYTSKDNKAYYIPTLRSAHTLFSSGNKKIESDIYLETIEKNYKISRGELLIFTGLKLYKNILNARNAKKELRKRFEEFEDFLSVNFFDGKELDIVAEFDKDESLKGSNSKEVIRVHVEGDGDYYLYELGDGIQAIIILMYQVFMAEPDSFIFIDEPELHLHPGMQRLFLEQLCNNEDLKKKNLTYFITTHSNHFLDLTIEKDNVSIYSFTPRVNEKGEKQFVIKNVNAGDNEILKHLGVNNSSVFMANCSIWVEGVSDRNYIKAFLYAYLESIKGNDDYKSIKEDIDFAFFEYAGSNIDHYFFGDLLDVQEEEVVKDINALALHNRIFLLADSDATDDGSAKKQRLENLKTTKHSNFIPYIIDGVREVENLLTNEIWKQVIGNFCHKDLIKSSEEEIESKITTALSSYNAKDYETQYIGAFLTKLRAKIGDIGGTKILNESCYIAKPKLGTFVYKRELSELVLKKIYNKEITWEHLSENPHIVALTQDIFKFIVASKS
ncbi:MAG: AAA family ATPase [Flavobacterium sp.]